MRNSALQPPRLCLCVRANTLHQQVAIAITPVRLFPRLTTASDSDTALLSPSSQTPMVPTAPLGIVELHGLKKTCASGGQGGVAILREFVVEHSLHFYAVVFTLCGAVTSARARRPLLQPYIRCLWVFQRARYRGLVLCTVDWCWVHIVMAFWTDAG